MILQIILAFTVLIVGTCQSMEQDSSFSESCTSNDTIPEADDHSQKYIEPNSMKDLRFVWEPSNETSCSSSSLKSSDSGECLTSSETIENLTRKIVRSTLIQMPYNPKNKKKHNQDHCKFMSILKSDKKYRKARSRKRSEVKYQFLPTYDSIENEKTETFNVDQFFSE